MLIAKSLKSGSRSKLIGLDNCHGTETVGVFKYQIPHTISVVGWVVVRATASMHRSVRSNVAINLQYLDRLEPWLCTPFALFGFSLVQLAQAGINRGTSL